MKAFDIKRLTPLKKAYIKFLTDHIKNEKLPTSFVVFIQALNKQKFQSQQELTDFIGCNKAHTSRTLFKMQLRGIIKLSCKKNGIELTEKGKAIAEYLSKIEQEFLKTLFKDIAENEQKIFENVLNKLIANSTIIGG